MKTTYRRALLLAGIAAFASARTAAGQHTTAPADTAAHDGHHGHGGTAGDRGHAGHRMPTLPLGGGWTATGMAQVYPLLTFGAVGDDDSPLHETEPRLTQGAAMVNVTSPGARWVLRTTLNAEAWTQPGGELTPGGWGEGFLDRRHPHTVLHEALLSLNLWDGAGGGFSLSAGKGFAPYGTDDPMSRPGAKYPTNHHLSQLLERWTVAAAFVRGPWSAEAGWFGGGEPEGPYDLSNVQSFGDSWSARVARRLGGTGTAAPWEISASAASVREVHHGEAARTTLWNAAVRHQGTYAFGGVYALAEASHAEPEGADRGWWSVLAEARVDAGRHQPYARVEHATRPEYARDGAPGTEGFFRYDHDAHPVGATRWWIGTLGYGHRVDAGPLSAWPFVEVQGFRVSRERGAIDPDALFGGSTFAQVTVGAKLFLGGGPMRMGSYGVLDDMTAMHRETNGMPMSER